MAKFLELLILLLLVCVTSAIQKLQINSTDTPSVFNDTKVAGYPQSTVNYTSANYNLTTFYDDGDLFLNGTHQNQIMFGEGYLNATSTNKTGSETDDGKGQNFFVSLWSAIAGFFSSIGNFFAGIFGRKKRLLNYQEN